MDINKDNYQKLMFFETTIDLSLEDGSNIKVGTEFLINKTFKNGQVELHFCADEENTYKNECGDNYIFLLEEIQKFAKPTQYSIDEYMKIVNYPTFNFKIQNLQVGGNFIDIQINYNDDQIVELHFYQIPKVIINKNLEIYGVSIDEKDMEDYDF